MLRRSRRLIGTLPDALHGLRSSLSLAASVASAGRAQAPAGPPSVGVVRAQQTAITETSEFVGRVQAIERVSLTARVTAFSISAYSPKAPK